MTGVINSIFSFVTSIGSSVDSETKAVKVDLSGLGSFDFASGTPLFEDQKGELPTEQETYQTLGFISRPLDPETFLSREFRAEAVAIKGTDSLIPIAWRDLRLERHFPNGIPKGTIRAVGYGGGFLSFDVTESHTGVTAENIATIYLPFDFNPQGVPQKAHAIVLDPDPANGITLTHSDGYQIALTETGILMRTPDSQTFFSMKAGEITATATKIMLKGNVYVGQSAEAGVPLLPGPASPPGMSFFVSPA